MSKLQSKVGNILLHTMAAADYQLLEPDLERIELPVRLQMHEAGRQIDHVYFRKTGSFQSLP